MRARIHFEDRVDPQYGYKYLCTIDPVNCTASHCAEVVSRYSAQNNIQLLYSIETGRLFICEDEPEDYYQNYIDTIGAILDSEPVRILWFSRHKMTTEQEADLKEIYGKVHITQVSESVVSWNIVANHAKSNLSDVIAAVLPPTILGDLVNNCGLPVIRAIANRVPTGGQTVNPANNMLEEEYEFQHVGWEQVDEVKIVTHRLKK